MLLILHERMSQHIPGELDYHVLKATARTQKRDLILPRKSDSMECTVLAFVRTGWNGPQCMVLPALQEIVHPLIREFVRQATQSLRQ